MRFFEEFRKSIPFENKRQLFQELRYSRCADSELHAWLDRFGDDTVVFCVYEAVGSGGYQVTTDQWERLKTMVPNHDQLSALDARLGLGGDDVDDPSTALYLQELLTEVAPSVKSDRLLTSSKYMPLAHGARSERLRALAREQHVLGDEIFDWVHDPVSDFSIVAWSAIAYTAENPNHSYDLKRVLSIPFDERDVVASVQAVARFRVRSRLGEFRVDLPKSTAKKKSTFLGRLFTTREPTLTWIDGTAISGDLERWVSEFKNRGYPYAWLQPLFTHVSHQTFDILGAHFDESLLSRWRFSAAQEELARETLAAKTPEQMATVLERMIDGALSAVLNDERAVEIFEKCGQNGRRLLSLCIERGMFEERATFDRLLEAADAAYDDDFYFRVYRATTDERTWIDHAMMHATTFADPTDALVKRHIAPKVREMLPIVSVGPKVAPYLLLCLAECTGQKRDWEIVRDAVNRWGAGPTRDDVLALLDDRVRETA